VFQFKFGEEPEARCRRNKRAQTIKRQDSHCGRRGELSTDSSVDHLPPGKEGWFARFQGGVGGDWRFSPASFEQWLESRKQKGWSAMTSTITGSGRALVWPVVEGGSRRVRWSWGCNFARSTNTIPGDLFPSVETVRNGHVQRLFLPCLQTMISPLYARTLTARPRLWCGGSRLTSCALIDLKRELDTISGSTVAGRPSPRIRV